MTAHPPHAICIGAQKSGTTWLYEQLKSHPDVALADRKEVNFFYKANPADRYADRFPDAPADRVRLDISPNYSAFSGLAATIHAHCPQARLLFILRDPAARAVSQYIMATVLGNIPADMPFIEAFEADRSFMKRRGRYLEIIEEYSQYYPLGDRLTVVFYDDLKRDPGLFLSAAQKGLGLRPWQPPDALSDRLTEPVAAGEKRAVATPHDMARVRAYYEPHNTALRNALGYGPEWLDNTR